LKGEIIDIPSLLLQAKLVSRKKTNFLGFGDQVKYTEVQEIPPVRSLPLLGTSGSCL
jgi:hypothetical protein